MRTIERSSAFKRDFKREIRGKHKATLESDLANVLVLLVQDQPLGAHYRDHDLSGDWGGYRECHIKSDLLLIYRKVDGATLRLARLGSHSEFSVERFLFSPFSCHMHENDPLMTGFGNRFEEIPVSVLVSVRGQKRQNPSSSIKR